MANSIGEFDYIKEVYDLMMPKIMEAPDGYDPYFVDWTKFFSPIESSAWGALRFYGLPFYPQFPIAGYFADFADPHKKIVLECDGKVFHRDEEKDAVRDSKMGAAGWSVFRLTGRECNAAEIDWEEISYLREGERDGEADWEIERWLWRSVDGFVAALASVYYHKSLLGVPMYFEPLLLKTIEKHRRSDPAWWASS